MTSEPITKPQPTTSRYQIVSSMTVDELLSEGYANYDDFYDHSEEEWKQELVEIEKRLRDNPIDYSEGIPF
ncbi:hypothetical protein [Calothrix sp. 336/3]|uniref:hypothetical protein n=1 Tax=Calothrix sp. 336/3 TaxID=1337936 RepID=UPI0005519DF6|nr:hypothetical protein [Calothrix sp. 336/3]AKG21326.1 hypothetical protein IJ00_08450 [Calothrix sp. 336/3]